MKKGLHIGDYAKDINLYDAFLLISTGKGNKEQIVTDLLTELNETRGLKLSYAEKRRLLHARINTLPANTFSSDAINKLNELLQIELKEKNSTSAEMLKQESTLSIGKTKLAVWQGDISTLKVDAIVNAANNQMLGCWQPLHACIDNVIHTAAGVQLRDDCNVIMQKQGFAEPTGTAKITRAYNLPSKFVLHTVGPIVRNELTAQNKSDLASAYTSCLEVGKEMLAIKSIAFCCISTGVFGYPAENAAKLAFSSVSNWLENNPGYFDLVVFNVFSQNDRTIYESLVNTPRL